MFCSKCGNKLEETSEFCVRCKAPTSREQLDTSCSGDNPSIIEGIKDEAKIPTKRRKRIIPIITGIVALIVLVGGVTSFLLYRKHIDKQVDNIIAYINNREYDEALTNYRKYRKKNGSFDKKVLTVLSQSVEKIKENYMSYNIDYNYALDELNSLDAFDNTDLDVVIYDCAQWIDRIKISRESFRVIDFDSTLYEHIYTEDDKEIMYVSIEFPILIGDSPSYESINQIIDSLRESYMNEINRMVAEARAYSDEEYFIPNGYEIAYSIQYNNDGMLCILLDGYTYAGGAHGYPLRKPLVFNLAEGSLMNLSDLISADPKAFADIITDEFQRMYNEAPEEYWEEALSIVKENALDMDSLNYYITEDSLYIFYFPYDLGSYARGFVDIVIPYLRNEWMFSFIFEE